MARTKLIERTTQKVDEVVTTHATANLDLARRNLLAASVQLERARRELHDAYAEARRVGAL